MTSTTIAKLPANWNVWEGSEAFPEWEEEIEGAFDELLDKRFPKYIQRVGDEIYGPATMKFGSNWDDKRHCYRFQRDTPDVADIPGAAEIMDDLEDKWLSDLLDAAGELARERAEGKVKQ